MANFDILKNKKISLKQRVCVFIGLNILKLYDNFRECSGVKKKTEEREREIEKNERVIAIVEEGLPTLKINVDALKKRNLYLEGRVTFMMYELSEIKKFALNGDTKSILNLLEKYNFETYKEIK